MGSNGQTDYWIIAVIPPDMLDDVRANLGLVGVTDLTVSHAVAFDRGDDSAVAYRGLAGTAAKPRIRIEVGCALEGVDGVVTAIRSAGGLRTRRNAGAAPIVTVLPVQPWGVSAPQSMRSE